jgi:hypothetical protein
MVMMYSTVVQGDPEKMPTPREALRNDNKKCPRHQCSQMVMTLNHTFNFRRIPQNIGIIKT